MDGRLNEFVIGFCWQTQRNVTNPFWIQGGKNEHLIPAFIWVHGHTADVFLKLYLKQSL